MLFRSVVNMLNTYLRTQAEIVRKYDGDIDKYVGDELVAVFQDGEDMIKKAMYCALEIHRTLETLNKRHSAWGDIRVGIGINRGDMIMGAVGSDERMDFTILGDHVNLGSRLCSHAGPGETILSKNAYRYIGKEIEKLQKKQGLCIVKEQVHVKGKSKPIQVYRIKES